jgi:uncharacterized membrane protein
MRSTLIAGGGSRTEGEGPGGEDHRDPYRERVALRGLPQHLARVVGESPLAERVARAQELAYGPLIEWARRSPLHSEVLGHSLHPPLTDVTAGCWLSTSLLDLAGGPGSRRGATLLTGFGFLASVPTAVAGAADWAELSGAERRIGAVHALGMDAAILLFVASLVARLRDRHRIGTSLALAGNVIIAGAGFLGGHLALHRGTARRTAMADRN